MLRAQLCSPAVFLIFGDKHRTELVPGGLTVTRECSKCGARASFRERRVSKQFRVYFIDMFTHDTHHVLECGACGTTFVTDELQAKQGSNDHSGTVYGHLQEAAGSAATHLQQAAAKAEALVTSEEVSRGLERGKREAQQAIGKLRGALDGLLSERDT